MKPHIILVGKTMNIVELCVYGFVALCHIIMIASIYLIASTYPLRRRQGRLTAESLTEVEARAVERESFAQEKRPDAAQAPPRNDSASHSSREREELAAILTKRIVDEHENKSQRTANKNIPRILEKELQRQQPIREPRFREDLFRDIVALTSAEERWALWEALYWKARSTIEAEVKGEAKMSSVCRWMSRVSGVNRTQLWKYRTNATDRQEISPETALRLLNALIRDDVGASGEAARILMPVAERMRKRAIGFIDWVEVLPEEQIAEALRDEDRAPTSRLQ
jgi:hypothetical protein